MQNYPIGGYKPADIIEIENSISTNAKNFWKGVRPLQYRSFFNRVKHAFNVLFYKADALYWTD